MNAYRAQSPGYLAAPTTVLVRIALLLLVSGAPRMAVAQDARIDITPAGAAPAGSTVTVKWSGPNGPGDYITVVRRGAGPSEYLDYRPTSDGRAPVNPVSIVMPAEPDAYEIRYVRGSPRSVLLAVPYEVKAVAASIEGPASIAPGSKFEVTWSGPNNGGDWVTIVAAGAAPRAYGSYVDARSGRADEKTGRRVATLRAPNEPGHYELRYVQQGTRVVGTRAIDVTAAPSGVASATPQPSVIPVVPSIAGATLGQTDPAASQRLQAPTAPSPGGSFSVADSPIAVSSAQSAATASESAASATALRSAGLAGPIQSVAEAPGTSAQQTAQGSGTVVVPAQEPRMQAPPQNAATGAGLRELSAAPPANLRVEPLNPGLQKLTWNDPGAGQFRVLRRSGSASTWTPVADPLTGTEYLDRTIVAPGTAYRVEAIYPRGVSAGTEVVHTNPLQPVFPQGFRGWQDVTEKVTLTWTAAANVAAYRLFGPGLPEGGARAEMHADSNPAGGYSVSYGLYDVPPGTHTFSITSEYGDGVYAVEGMPTTTVIATARKSRYRITVTGFRVNQATNDDPILHRDGKGDEVFVAVFVGSALSSSSFGRTIVRSRVYGDVNQFPDRIQAGSSSPYGGIGPGDAVPANAGSTVTPMSAMPDTLPLLVWEGELWDGDYRGLAIVPTIWEWDGDDKNYRMWSGWLTGTRYDWLEVLERELKPDSIRVYGIGPKLGADTFGVVIDDSFGKDLPIGYRNVGATSLTTADRPSFSSSAFLMSRGRIERSLGSHQTVVLPINWRGLGGVGGDYDLYLQVERLP